MGDPRFPARSPAAGRPGAYLRIVEEGGIAAGDAIRVGAAGHGVTIGLVERAYHTKHAGARLLDAPELPEGWVDWARHVIDARTA